MLQRKLFIMALCAGTAVLILIQIHLRRETAALQKEMANLAHSVSAIPQQNETERFLQTRASFERQDPTVMSDAKEGGSPTPDDEVRRARTAAVIESLPTVLRSRFEGEPRDRAWSWDTQERLRDQISHLESAVAQVTSVECRTSLCRVEGTFKNQASFNGAMHSLFGSTDSSRIVHGGAVAPVVTTSDDGKIEAVVYMAREGAQLVPTETSPD